MSQNPKPSSKSSGLPRKRFYRARAHSNPLSDSHFPVPINPSLFNLSEHYPHFFPDQSNAPKRIEFADIGCGFGGLLVTLSPIFPDTLMIGMEIRDKVASYVDERIRALRTPLGDYHNISVVRTNSMKYLPNYFEKAQLSKMFFLFPDPHFKEKNRRRRVISESLLDEYAYVMKVGGLVYAVTDVEELGEWIRGCLERHCLFQRVGDEEAAGDPVAKVLESATEEGKKVLRNGGQTFRITLSELLLLTTSQRYVPATIQTAIINASPAIVFVLALIFKREIFKFWSIRDQAKLWGLVLSVLGATIMVLWPGPELRDPTRLGETQTQSNWALGCLLVSCGVMALASSTLLVEHVATKFDSNMSLAAMTSLSGAIQSGIVAATTEKNGSAWLGLFQCGLGIGTILYGGIVVAGLMFYAQIWCIHKQGPVFVGAFSPLLIVFSFLLETPIFGTCVHAGSVFGSIIVVFGLHLLLWGKAVVEEEEESIYGGSKTIEENYPIIVPNYESFGLNYPLISNMSGFPILVT